MYSSFANCAIFLIIILHVVIDKTFSYNFSKAVNPKKLAAAKTPTTSASLTFISLSFSYSAARARAKAAKKKKRHTVKALLSHKKGGLLERGA